jgi:hypothetical protein
LGWAAFGAIFKSKSNQLLPWMDLHITRFNTPVSSVAGEDDAAKALGAIFSQTNPGPML